MLCWPVVFCLYFAGVPVAAVRVAFERWSLQLAGRPCAFRSGHACSVVAFHSEGLCCAHPCSWHLGLSGAKVPHDGAGQVSLVCVAPVNTEPSELAAVKSVACPFVLACLCCHLARKALSQPVVAAQPQFACLTATYSVRCERR